MILRRMTDADYPALVAFHNLCRPDTPVSEEDLRFVDRAIGEGDVCRRDLLERDGVVVGASLQATEHVGVRQFRLDLLIHPQDDLETLGDRLYRATRLGLAPHRPAALLAGVREDWSEWLSFYQDRGFHEFERMWESLLDVRAFDPGPFAAAPAAAAQAGVTFQTLADLPDDEATRHLVYELVVELLSDVPHRDGLNIWPYEVWQERYWHHPKRNPESMFLAFCDSTPVGLSELRRSNEPGRLDTGLTGVRRPWRRQGVAQSLKLLAVQFARDHGARVIGTQNHSVNRPMLAINEAMGFVKQPAWIRLKKDLREEVSS